MFVIKVVSMRYLAPNMYRFRDSISVHGRVVDATMIMLELFVHEPAWYLTSIVRRRAQADVIVT